MDNYRTLEVKLISAENLKHVSNPFSSKMNVYALVYMISNANDDTKCHESRRKERTRRDRTGGCNPTWNSTFRFVVPVVDAGTTTTTTTGLSLRIVLRTGHGIGHRDVGELTVPLCELLAGSSVAHDENFTVSKRVSYQLVRRTKMDSEEEEEADGDGGVLNLSYRFLRIMDTLRPRTATTEYNPDSFTAPPPTLGPGTSTKTKVAAFVEALFVGLTASTM